MLYHLFTSWVDVVGPLRVFRYPSFRIPAAALTALVIMLWFFPRFIEYLRAKQHGVSNVREDTPEQHQVKTGTPTMGGVFILVSLTISTLLWADLSNIYVWSVLIVTIGFGLIGFVDDYRKVSKKNSKGLAGRYKLLCQLFILTVVTILLSMAQNGAFGSTGFQFDTTVSVPFVSIRLFNPDIGWLYIPFAFLVVMGTSNAVNLTDGLDGLAIGPTVVSASTPSSKENFAIRSFIPSVSFRNTAANLIMS